MVRTTTERRGARHEHIRPGIDALPGDLCVDTAIDFEVDWPTGLVDHLAHGLDLAKLAGDERLAAEPGVDGHDQHEIDLVDQVVEDFGGRRRIERDAGLLAQRLDRLHRAMRVGTRFGMDGDDVGTRCGKCLKVGIDRRDHQMDVEGLGAVGFQRFDHRRADGDVRHEMPVHHVDMNPVGTGAVDRAHLFAQPRKIGRKDGRRNQRHIHADHSCGLGQTRVRRVRAVW